MLNGRDLKESERIFNPFRVLSLGLKNTFVVKEELIKVIGSRELAKCTENR